MGSVSLHPSKEVPCPYPLTVTAMHCVVCGRPACYIADGWLPVSQIWTQVRACRPDVISFPLSVCAEHKEQARTHSQNKIVEEIIAVLKTGKTPSAKRGLDATSIPKRAVPFGTLAVGACFYRLNRQGQPITDTFYVRADTEHPGGPYRSAVTSGGVRDIYNAVSLGTIDARAGVQSRSYVFDDWLLVMPVD